jgi:hypothetical protein
MIMMKKEKENGKNKCHSTVVSTPASYAVCLRFESSDFFIVSLYLILGQYLKTGHDHIQFIIHSHPKFKSIYLYS